MNDPVNYKVSPDISFVIPLFNEEEGFSQLIERLQAIFVKLKEPVEAVLVDDGSTDNTPVLMEGLATSDYRFTSVFLSRNFGHQTALTAGLANVNANKMVMVLDGDLQDPPEMIFQFLKYYNEGYEVIYAIRKKRKENIFKKAAYHIFYRLLKSISYINLPIDSGDFCLMSRRVVDHLNSMPEESRYIRGMRSWIGFKQIGIEYERNERAHGVTKYSLKKLWKLAYDGIFNFSEFPVKFMVRMGTLAFLIAIVYFAYTLARKILFGDVPEGFTALLFTVILFSGVQLISLGVLGEYIVRIFFQVKKRPLFIVKKLIRKGKVDN